MWLRGRQPLEPIDGDCCLCRHFERTWASLAIPWHGSGVPGTLPDHVSDILARATAWAGETEEAENEIFNITNGDYFRWQFMWPRIAQLFEMNVAEPVPMPLAVYMADKGELWAEMTRKYRLQSTPYEQVAAWRFGDFIFGTGFDNITSTIKARRAGFHACIDTEDMFSNLFNDLRQKRVIPQLS
jgi:hypothetical protein